MEGDMTNPKDRMTIFPEEKSGESGDPGPDTGRSAKRPGETQATPVGKGGQKKAKDFSNDLDRQTLGGKMGRSDD